MNVSTTNFNYGQKLLALVLMAFIMISVAWLSPSSRNNIISRAEEVYNDEAELKDQSPDATPDISETKITQVQKRVNGMSGVISNKNKKAVPPAYQNQNDFPVLADGVMLLPPTPPPPPATEDRFGIIVSPSPFLNQDLSAKLFDNPSLYVPHDFTDNDTKWNTPEWLNVYSELKEQLNSKISLNDLALFMDASKIKVLQNQLLNQAQLQGLLKHLNDIQLQYENMIERQQNKSIALEKKANNRSNKDYTSENKDQSLFFKQLKAMLPDTKKMFTEEKLKLDSIRKVSAELAEKQKQIWLERTKEEGVADEQGNSALYELIVLVENNIKLNASTDLQNAVSIEANTGEELNKNLKKSSSNLSGKSAFSFTLAPSERSSILIKQKPVHRSINIRKNQTQVFSL